MARLFFLLALFFFMNDAQAVDYKEDAKSCEKLLKYTGNDAGFASAVSVDSGFVIYR
jgi:hypothetical protein